MTIEPVPYLVTRKRGTLVTGYSECITRDYNQGNAKVYKAIFRFIRKQLKVPSGIAHVKKHLVNPGHITPEKFETITLHAKDCKTKDINPNCQTHK